MRAVIDRFEEKWAVLETEGRVIWQVPRDFLPPEAGEGDTIEFSFKKVQKSIYNNRALMEEIFE
ncbi:MAG: DUF3006 domain-containing protein [Bacillota bacterium]